MSNLCVLFFPCVVQKSNTHVGTKALNICHQAQKVFCGIFVGNSQHQKKYLVYVPHTLKIISLYNVVFDYSSSSELVYMSQPYAEAMDMQLVVS